MEKRLVGKKASGKKANWKKRLIGKKANWKKG